MFELPSLLKTPGRTDQMFNKKIKAKDKTKGKGRYTKKHGAGQRGGGAGQGKTESKKNHCQVKENKKIHGGTLKIKPPKSRLVLHVIKLD